MQQKNTPISILRKFEDMPLFVYKVRFFIALIFASLLLLIGCSKSPVTSNDTAIEEALFTSNILNRNFIVQFASDSNIDITSQYVKDTFVLKNDTSYYNGTLTASKAGTIYTGTWSSNSDYSELIIDITAPPIPQEFNFLNTAWRFTKKDFPIMQLAPGGNTSPKILYMERL